jgi:tetratricopeptide (TPR) repeat protein
MHWESEIEEAIRTCSALIFVMTADSVNPVSECANECRWAEKCKKPILPVRADFTVEPPYRLARRNYLDFAPDFDAAFSKLVDYLAWLPTPEGTLHQLKEQRNDLRREVERSPGASRGRIAGALQDIERAIEIQERIVRDPAAAAKRTEESIIRSIQTERTTASPPSGPVGRVVSSLPTVPRHFQNRFVETKLLGDLVADSAVRAVVVVGRGGIGKTSMVCRLLHAFLAGTPLDGATPIRLAGAVYLDGKRAGLLNFPSLFEQLTKPLPDPTRQRLQAVFADEHGSVGDKMRSLLAELIADPIVVLLDNFEDAIDFTCREIRDAELAEALQTIVQEEQHGLKLIMTTRVAPTDLMLIEPGRCVRLDLDAGLESPYAEQVLLDMDVGGKLGLRALDPAVLHRAVGRACGYPRALEALFMTLAADHATSLEDLLNTSAHYLPSNVVEKLVGEAFSRLDQQHQQVTQALAILGQPVVAGAVDFVLAPWNPATDAAPALGRLVNMHFVRVQAGRHSLHPVDREYALGRIPDGSADDSQNQPNPPFTKFALRRRGADYFQEIRKPLEACNSLEDLAPALAEFDLRCEALEYDKAADLALLIDDKHLERWGHYSVLVRLYGRLRDAEWDGAARARVLRRLGNAHRLLGEVQTAVVCVEQGIALEARRSDGRSYDSMLNDLAICYADLGQTERAIECLEKVLLANLEGLTLRSIDPTPLFNLGTCYSEMGWLEPALACLELSRDQIAPPRQGLVLESLAFAYADAGRLDEALAAAHEAVRIGQRLAAQMVSAYSLRTLALVELLRCDPAQARQHAEAAHDANLADVNHHALLIAGIAALEQGDGQGARASFEQSLAAGDILLRSGSTNYLAFDSRGLALCGLVACGDATRVSEARAAFDQARHCNRAAGLVRRTRLLLDRITPHAPAGQLQPVVREADTWLDDLTPAQRADAADGHAALLAFIFTQYGWEKHIDGFFRLAPNVQTPEASPNAKSADGASDPPTVLDRLTALFQVVRRCAAIPPEHRAAIARTVVDLNLTEQRRRQAQLDFEIAARFGVAAVDLCEADERIDSGVRATALNNLAFTRLKLGDTEAAKPLLQRALSLSEEAPDTPSTAATCNNLAEAYLATGDLEAAMSYCDRALTFRLDHRLGNTLAITLTTLGSLLRRQQRLAEAEGVFQLALQEHMSGGGSDSPAAIETLSRYAELLRELNRESEASAIEARVNDGRTMLSGRGGSTRVP